MSIVDKRKEVSKLYAEEFNVSDDEAAKIIFKNNRSLHLTYNGYEFYKEKFSCVIVQLDKVLTTRQILFLARYMSEPYLTLSNGKSNKVFIFDQKVATYLALCDNDMERFVNSKKISLD